ncbi:MAG: hypothetical protein GX962_05065 [Epulopiscium sp.]|nr:hypothetical protein [Candidatus Epulonipiscium sp.]
MEDNVDILILTASFGVGHLSASLGIKEHISKINPSISIEVVDVFQRTMPRFSKIMYEGYDILVKRNQKLYNYFYL